LHELCRKSQDLFEVSEILTAKKTVTYRRMNRNESDLVVEAIAISSLSIWIACKGALDLELGLLNRTAKKHVVSLFSSTLLLLANGLLASRLRWSHGLIEIITSNAFTFILLSLLASSLASTASLSRGALGDTGGL